MTNKLLKCADDICKEVDELAKLTLEPGSLLYNFQKSMIINCKIYRESRDNELTTCTESGITFNKKGEIVI